MEKALKSLFDYQLFEKNPRIEALMADTMSRQEVLLSDDELEFVNAAGDVDCAGKNPDEHRG